MQDAVTMCKLFFECYELSINFSSFLAAFILIFLANLQAACSKKFERKSVCVGGYNNFYRKLPDKYIMAGINMCVWINVAVYR